MSELPKTFDPAEIEKRWYAYWEGSGLFRPDSHRDGEPFTIVMPPPNVTGSLHLGHALDNTLQDILVRRERMRGRDALWVVGTDHAGIATQMVVERNLALHQQKRTDFTRDEFVGKVWEWKEESGGAITRQLRRLGASCDWSHERFTMDPGFSKAVVKVFVELWKRKLLYRDKRLVNWDPRFQTAISDLEVETKEVPGKFWHLKYPLADGSGSIEVATTRPETMLADMAVAVHPDDERYKAIVGKEVRLPITGRLAPVIADEHADPELGSGAVKITPGHDFNDFEVGKRAGIKPADMLNMLDPEARVVQTQDGLVPQELLGLSREDARKRVVELLEAEGALVSVEDRVIPTPFGDRSGVVIEPWLTDQWYVDVKPLASQVIEATKAGKIRIVPESWAKTWFHWLENIQPWCVSRQLWWGHRIPAWYGLPREAYDQYAKGAVGTSLLYAIGSGEVKVAEDEASAKRLFASYYGVREDKVVVREATFNAPEDVSPDQRVITHDPDVLDTWFSSALWPFATLGWPEQTDDLKRHYPNDVLISGFDILFFWDARMAMQGIEFMGEVPWRTLYLHGLVRDAQGAKMSKSKGNTVAPLGLIDKYGADALRFTLAAMESQGRDIKLDEKRVEGYRNFATKLWNAARFLQMNGVGASDSIAAPAAELPVNRWIIGQTIKTVQALDLALADLRFDESANTVYHFVWASFCDWYLELIKPILSQSPSLSREGLGVGASDEVASPSAEDEAAAQETRAVAGWVLDQILAMLHPFMPFITEELWHALADREGDLIVGHWPMADARATDPEASAEVEWLIKLVSEIRAARAELNVPPGAKLPLFVADASAETAARLDRQHGVLSRLARLDSIQLSAFSGKGAAQVVVDEATFALPLEGVIDLDAERARLAKGAEAAEKERDSLAGRLANPSFVERAKPEAVAKAREDHDAKAAEAERLRAALGRLG